MSLTTTHGPISTAQAGITPLTFPIAPLNFPVDYSPVKDVPGEVIYTDLTTLREQPSTLRIASQAINNVYAGSDIDPSHRLANSKGISTLISLKEVWQGVDSEIPDVVSRFPVGISIVLQTPNTSFVGAADVKYLVAKAVAAFFASGVQTADTGINAQLRGVVKK